MSFKDRIKKILKIALPVIAVLFIGYHMLFYTVKMTREETKELEEDYGGYILYSAREFAWYVDQLPLPKFRFRLYPTWSIKRRWKRNVVLFRWKANDLKKKMESELKQELEELKQNYPVVTDYIYDEDNFILDVYMDESKGEDYYEICDYVNGHIQDKFLLLNTFCQEENFFSYKQYGEFNIHDVEDEATTEDDEDVYAENDLKVLEEILSRSEQERPFTKLRYVCLENTKADKVILPESLKYIDQGAFRNCINLEEITIPKGVDRISRSIFWGCKNLKKVTFEGDAPEVEKGQGKVFGKVSEDLRIYHEKFMEGWQEKCWEDYDMVEILPRIIRQREGSRS